MSIQKHALEVANRSIKFEILHLVLIICIKDILILKSSEALWNSESSQHTKGPYTSNYTAMIRLKKLVTCILNFQLISLL
jgi:hypothetical protein